MEAGGQLQRWVAAHGRVAALVIVGLGCVVLALATALIRSMGLPGLLYLPALLAAGTLWVGALAVYAVHRASRRSSSSPRGEAGLGGGRTGSQVDAQGSTHRDLNFVFGHGSLPSVPASKPIDRR
jgi:hypothetical protein